jgi:hypothetical protein
LVYSIFAPLHHPPSAYSNFIYSIAQNSIQQKDFLFAPLHHPPSAYSNFIYSIAQNSIHQTDFQANRFPFWQLYINHLGVFGN